VRPRLLGQIVDDGVGQPAGVDPELARFELGATARNGCAAYVRVRKNTPGRISTASYQSVPESWPAAEDHEQKAKNSKRKPRFNRNCRFGIAGEYAIVGKNSA